MQGALPASPRSPLAGNSFVARYGTYAGAVVAALIGLLVLPALFHAIDANGIQIADRVSVVDIVWLVVGVVLSIVLLATRGAMVGQLSTAIRTRLEVVQQNTDTRGTGESVRAPQPHANLPSAGSTTAARLFDIIFLLVIQAILREPLIGVAKAWVPEATVDGAYVVLVVVIALVFLINVRAVSRPLLDYLLWLGLDAAVPTAGFVTSNASETFTRMTATTTTSRTGTGRRTTTSGRTSSYSTGDRTGSDPSGVLPTMVEGSVEATVAAPTDGEATTLEPQTGAETVYDAGPELESTVVERSGEARGTPDATVVASDAEETVVAGPDEAGDRKLGPKSRSEGDR